MKIQIGHGAETVDIDLPLDCGASVSEAFRNHRAALLRAGLDATEYGDTPGISYCDAECGFMAIVVAQDGKVAEVLLGPKNELE